MGIAYGTNLTTVDGTKITAGQMTASDTAQQLTAETGPLTHGIFMTPVTSASYYLNASGGSPEVTAANGILIKANNPLFIPIKDPSKLRIISTAAGKTMSFIMY